MLPSQQLLEKVNGKIMSVPNRKKESKRKIHYCLFLLGYKSGLRISEAVHFDLATKNKQGLYRIKKPKGKKERLVYIPKKVIRELKKHNWQPNQTNRFNFYHFLRKIKKELGISKSIELTPHTLRRAFATYQAESGLPLPLLQKLLGHSSIRTTALYWRNIYQEPDNDIGSILAGKNWLERHDPSQSKEPPKPPSMEIFPLLKVETFSETPKAPKPIFIENKPVISNKNLIQQDNSLSPISAKPKSAKIDFQFKPVISEIQTKPSGKIFLNSKTNQQSEISQPLALITKQKAPPTEKETILLQKIKHLEEQLKQVQVENGNLKTKNKVLKNLVSAEQNKHLKALAQQSTKAEAKIIQLLPCG
ncbi:MAG: tyrosine recombinase XerD [Mycoplasmataceae bacterium RV_VA103A]|nr:MAG: tyrosine recombinase XerD [Mycoplasmataceae bacterium RV_VA103A]